MKPKTPKKTPENQSQLAAALGVSRQLIAHHAKKPGAPNISDVEGWLEYFATHGREGSIPPELRKKIFAAKLRILNSQAAQGELDLAERRGELINFATVDRFLGRIIGEVFFGELSRMAEHLPGVLKGMDEVTIHEKLIADAEGIKGRLRDELKKIRANGLPEGKA